MVSEFRYCIDRLKKFPLSKDYFKRTAYGLSSNCKGCIGRRRGNEVLVEPLPLEKLPEELRIKDCSKCGGVFPRTPEEFGKAPKTPGGLGSTCRKCRNIVSKKSRERTPEHHQAVIETTRQYWRDNKEKISEQKKEYRDKKRKEVFSVYGNKCACCSEAKPQFLTIDHVHGGGKKERESKVKYAKITYMKVLSEGCPLDGRYRLLCFNCNMSFGLYGRCPHQTKQVRTGEVQNVQTI